MGRYGKTELCEQAKQTKAERFTAGLVYQSSPRQSICIFLSCIRSRDYRTIRWKRALCNGSGFYFEGRYGLHRQIRKRNMGQLSIIGRDKNSCWSKKRRQYWSCKMPSNKTQKKAPSFSAMQYIDYVWILQGIKNNKDQDI